MTAKTKRWLIAGLVASGSVTVAVATIVLVFVMNWISGPAPESPSGRALKLVKIATAGDVEAFYELIPPSMRHQFADEARFVNVNTRGIGRSPRQSFQSNDRSSAAFVLMLVAMATKDCKLTGEEVEGNRAWVRFKTPQGSEESISMFREEGRWYFFP